MTSLRDLQQAFVQGVLNERSLRVCALIAGNGLAPEMRLGIYRNNAREGLLKTLEASFPVIVQLAGADWFRQTGLEYMQRHPSCTGNLHHVSERFPGFLAAQLRDTPYEYFADVARLEWGYQEVLVAADRPAFEIAALQSVTPEDYDVLTFEVHPALRLVASSFPILAIWQANQPAASETCEPIRLDAGASRVLVIRRDDHVELRELSVGEFALLQAFARSEPFAAATECALAADADADLSAAFARLMQLGTLVDFSVGPLAPCDARTQRGEGLSCLSDR